MGMPVVATKWGRPADYLDSATGVLIEPHDRKAMVAQIADAIRQPALRTRTPERDGDGGSREGRAILLLKQ